MPFRDPPELRARPGDPLRLVAQPTRFSLSGRPVWGESYGRSFVAPTLRFAPGQHVRLVLGNRLPMATDLHFHGLHVSPSGAADNPFVTVSPGHSFTYRLNIPADHPQGTFWYHDHQMAMPRDPGAMAEMPGHRSMGGRQAGNLPPASAGLSTSDLENQTMSGLTGTVLIGDDRTLLPPALRHVTSHILALKDVQLDDRGHIVQTTTTASINSNSPTVRLVNGQLRPVLSMRPGETQLWRLANEGADIFYRLHLDRSRFTVVGEDGDPVTRLRPASTLLLPPGKRYDVLVTAGPRPGAIWLRTLAYSNGPQGDSYPQARLLRLRIAGRRQAPQVMPAGAMPTAAGSLAGAHVARKRTVVLSEDSTATKLYINSAQFSMARSIFSTPGIVNTVEQWTVLNTSGEVHPFHIHTNHFQVMSINGVPQPYQGTQDTVPIPYQRGSVPGRVVLRIRLARFTGKWMFHCHIAAHEDNGMMSYLNVVALGKQH
jgi:FtsP/CotA-like multicopper oxidase with cupredoxin domain